MTPRWYHLALWIVPAALWPTSSAAAQQPDTLRLSLTQAVERALDQSEEIAIARAWRAQADARLTQASAAALPHISTAITYNRTIRSVFDALAGFQGADSNSIPSAFDETRSPRERYDTLSSLMMADFMEGLIQGLPFGRRNTYVSLFQVSQPLFAGGRISGVRASARHGLTAAEYQLEETAADLVLQVRVAYLNAVLGWRLQAIAVESRRMAALLIPVIYEKLDRVGAALRRQVVRIETGEHPIVTSRAS